jgi:O-antigen/teichoic acid export membrane protein
MPYTTNIRQKNVMKIFKQSITTQRLSLRANFSWTLLGNIIYRFSQWGFIVVLAKLSSPELLGQYILAIAITAPIFMFSNLGLTIVQTTDAQDHHILGDYLGLRIISSLLALLFIASILLLGDYQQDMITLIIIVSLAKFIESMSDTFYGLMQKQERFDLVAQSLVVRGLASLLTFALVLYFFQSLIFALITQIIVWGLTLLTYDLRNVRHWQSAIPHFELPTLFRLFWLALPLGIVAGLGSLSIQIPRYAMEYFRDRQELGIFAAIAALSLVINLITSALSRSALPRLSRLFAQREFEQFKQLLFKLMTIGVVVGTLGVVGAAIFGKAFLTLAYTEEYAQYTDVLIIIMANAGIITTLSFLGTALSATRQFSVQVRIHLLKIGVVASACYLLIPIWGALGAAWAILISSIVSGCVYAFILWRTVHRSKREVKIKR